VNALIVRGAINRNVRDLAYEVRAAHLWAEFFARHEVEEGFGTYHGQMLALGARGKGKGKGDE